MLNDIISSRLSLPVARSNWSWLQVILVAAVLLLSAASSAILSRTQLLLLFVLLVGVIGVFLVLRYPPMGLIGVVVGGLFVPFSRANGQLNAAVLITGFMLGAFILGFVVQEQPPLYLPARIRKSLIALVAISTIAFLAGQMPWFSFARAAPLDAQLGGFATTLLSLGIFLLAAYHLRALAWLKWLTWAFLGLGAIFITMRIVPALSPYAVFQRQAVSGSLFWVWLVALAAGQAIYNKRLHARWRMALGLLVAATLYVAYFQSGDWKSGWLPPLVVIITIVSLRSWRYAILLTVIGVTVTPGLASSIIAADQYSYSTRIDAWLILLQIIRVSPLIGLGFANYYWYTPLYRIRGYSVNFNSHSQYMDLLAQTGIIGLACFTWLIVEIGRLGWRLKSIAPEGFPKAYVYATLAGLAGTVFAGLLGDWILPFVYNVGLRGFSASMLCWLFWGGLIAVDYELKRSSGKLTTAWQSSTRQDEV